MLRRRLAEIDAEMARLAGLRDQLTAMLDAIPGPACPDPAPGTWRPASALDGGTAVSEVSACCGSAPDLEGR